MSEALHAFCYVSLTYIVPSPFYTFSVVVKKLVRPVAFSYPSMIWSLLKPDFLELLLFIISSSNFLCHNFFFLFLQKLSLIKLQFEQVLFLVFLFRLFRILLHFIFRSQLQFCILQIHNFSVISLTQTVLIYLELRVGKYETPVLQNKNFFSYLEKQEVFQELSLKLSRSLEINSLVHPKVF